MISRACSFWRLSRQRQQILSSSYFFSSWVRIVHVSSTHSIRSGSVTSRATAYPQVKCMPFDHFEGRLHRLDSSTVDDAIYRPFHRSRDDCCPLLVGVALIVPLRDHVAFTSRESYWISPTALRLLIKTAFERHRARRLRQPFAHLTEDCLGQHGRGGVPSPAHLTACGRNLAQFVHPCSERGLAARSLWQRVTPSLVMMIGAPENFLFDIIALMLPPCLGTTFSRGFSTA